MGVEIAHYEDVIRKLIISIEINNNNYYKAENNWSSDPEGTNIPKWMNGSDNKDFYCNLLSNELDPNVKIEIKRPNTKKGKTVYPYFDIDDVDSPKNCAYYSDLTCFLNKRATSLEKEYKFLQPSETPDKSGECNESCKDVKGADEVKIALIKDDTPLMLLTSDTFGFGADGNALSDNTHAYGIYYNCIKKDNDNEKEYMFIGKCVYDTRTLGGAFLWPVNMVWNNYIWKGTRYSDYNNRRGTGGYIEDRVDLTLLEIKHFYNAFSEQKQEYDRLAEYIKEYFSDILFNCLKPQTKMWFNCFDSFEEYVDFFMFHPFVVKIVSDDKSDYVPIDIFNSEIPEKGGMIGKNDYIPDAKKRNERCLEIIEGTPDKKEIQSCKDSKKIKQMLNNVRLLTLARSRMMTAFTNKNDWKQYDPKWTENDLVKQKIALSSKP